jgi:hypothetical protein
MDPHMGPNTDMDMDMTPFSDEFFSTDLVDSLSYGNDNPLPEEQAATGEPYAQFDNNASVYPALDVPVPSRPYYDADLMNQHVAPTIGYQDDYQRMSSGSSGGYISPRRLLDSGIDQVQGQGPNSLRLDPIDPEFLERESAQQSPYFNVILNSFSSPTTPLRVIDRVNFPFEQELQSELEKALEQEKERGNDQQLVTAFRNGMASPVAGPSTASRRIATLKKAGNKRPENIKNFNASAFYEPLQFRPESWGSTNPNTGDQLFQYTEHGELNPLHSFTTEQIVEYLAKHPLHGHGPYGPDFKNSGLTLWVQTVPADSGRRYPDKLSDKCRFAECPDPNRTIRKGEFRIAFDEQPIQRRTDPFHNAGYVHLYCMEKFLDFPDLCKKLKVEPDVREFREGKNKMAITRDHPSMAEVVNDFIVESPPWSDRAYFPSGRPGEFYRLTLCSQLTEEHLAKQPKHLQKIREQRGGNSIDVHKNDLDLCVELNKQNKLGKTQRGPKPKVQKRTAAEDEDEGVLDDDILASSPRHKRRRKESGCPTAFSVNPGKWRKSPSSRRPKIRRKKNAASIPSPKRHSERPSLISTRKRSRGSGSLSSASSSKRRKQSDSGSSSEPKLRRSPRSPRTPGQPPWGFSLPALPF